MVLISLITPLALAEETYKVDISVQAANDTADANSDAAAIKTLLEKHMQMNTWRENARMNPTEWQRLFNTAPQDIKNLVATKGYFSPVVSGDLQHPEQTHLAKFIVILGNPAIIHQVDIQFSGAIANAPENTEPSIATLQKQWLLPKGAQFRQELWTQAKQQLLTSLLIERYPNATITASLAEIRPETNTVALKLEVNSGDEIRYGELSIEGLERYSPSVVKNLNPIKPHAVYAQSSLLTFQTRLQESGYFRNVEVTTDTKVANADNQYQAPIKIKVEENKSIKLGIGAGYSTNTGARAQLTLEDLNLLDRDWRFASTLKVEQKAQSLVGQILFPTTKKGFRDSLLADINRTDIEGLVLTSSQIKLKRAWGPHKREQYIGVNYLVEQEDIDDGDITSKKVATLNYAITLRHTDNILNPTRGYLFNGEFAYAPFDRLSSGSFLHSRLKAQAYYPITNSTQLITRAEIGVVNGKNSAPETFLFRVGGDQSVRGYAFQSLGVKEANAIVGGKLMATGSVEIIQWLTQQWGAAIFVDAGNAANQWKDLKPVYGYGLGARWKSPLGPIGADIAYGAEEKSYRLHFSIGVAF